MININIPRTSSSSFQPDYTKTAEFPGFTFYHSLKEWYFIYQKNIIKSYPDSLLDSLNLKGSFSFLIGNNTNNIFIGQCETANLGKLQVDPNTGDQLSFEVIDIKAIVQQQTSSNIDVLLTSGYVNGSTIILTAAASVNDSALVTQPRPIIIISKDNGGTWEARNMVTTPLIDQQIPTGICCINFYDTYYLVSLVRSYNTDNSYFFIGSEEDILNNNDTLYYHQSIQTISPTFNTDRRIPINTQLHWNHNSLHFLNDDRTRYIKASTHLHKTQLTYTTPYPIPNFEFTFNNLTSDTYTQIEAIKDNSVFSTSTLAYRKSEVVSNGSISQSINQLYSKGLVWDTVREELNDAILDFRLTQNEVISLVLKDNNGQSKPFIEKRSINNITAVNETALDSIPMDRFNTGGIHWNTGEEVVEPLPNNWATNTVNSKWISIDADTNSIDYGSNNFDYSLSLSIELPEDTNLAGTVYYADEILDILIDGISTNNSYTSNGLNGLPINLAVTRGAHTITFNIRKLGAAGANNPTGIRLDWNNISVGNNGIESPSFFADYTDMLIDEVEDKLYVSLGRSAWIISLSTLDIISYLDLHAEPLIFNPPYPPGYDPLVITGVVDDTNVPVRWKWVKNFNDVYIHNSFHDTTFSSSTNKEFYMWVVDSTDPSYHTMFSAFDLSPQLIMKLEYFYDINQELHLIALKNSAGFNRTYQYRLNGLARFNQLSQGEVLVGTLNFNNVYLDRQGSVYITESDEPNFTNPQNSLFVYKNSNANNLSEGNYIIEIDSSSLAFDADRASKIVVEPPLHDGVHPEYWSKSLTYTEIPGDYIAKVFLNSDKFRNETNTELDELYGSTINFGSRTDLNLTLEQVLKAEMDPQRHWTYLLTYDDLNLKHRLIRTRALFYPST